MKVTKYPQSCLLIEKEDQRIVIDPGIGFTAKYKLQNLGDIKAVLYTHQHADHFDDSIVNQLKSNKVPMYGNMSVARLIGEGAIEVKTGEKFTIADFEILPHDLPHARMPDGSDGPPNTGYIIDGNFFHPGDGLETQGVSVATVAAPILSPSTSFYQANQLAIAVGAKRLIPIHNDLNFIADPETFKKFNSFFENLTVEVIALQNGQSVDL